MYLIQQKINIKNLMAVAREGKGYPTLKEEDLFYLKFDKKIIQKLELKQYKIADQIEPIEKKIKELKSQLKDNTNIFPSQIQEFPLIDIPLSRQQKIVDEIKAELDKQEEIKKEIEKLRNKIDEIIENAVK